MSHSRQIGKDKVIFATKEDHATPSSIELPEPEPAPGLILPSGEINWNCPCLGGMAVGPCGFQFREAFSCFHYSEAEPKGSDCYDAFKTMQECMSKYPTLYNKNGDKDEGEDNDDEVFEAIAKPLGNSSEENATTTEEDKTKHSGNEDVIRQ